MIHIKYRFNIIAVVKRLLNKNPYIATILFKYYILANWHTRLCEYVYACAKEWMIVRKSLCELQQISRDCLSNSQAGPVFSKQKRASLQYTWEH